MSMLRNAYRHAKAWLRADGRAGGGVPSVPVGCRVYAVGDVHGRHDLLQEMVGRIEADAAAHGCDSRNILIFLGDYVDRGGDSRAVVGMLAGLDRHWPDIAFLRGNHEQAMLDFLDAAPNGRGWLDFGGRETLASYGLDPNVDDGDAAALAAVRAQLRASLPPQHLAFLRGLGFSIAVGDYFFAHAGIRPGIPLDAQSPDDLMWIREPFLSSRRDHGKIIVHGHSIRQQPEMRANRIGIDTGAWASGRLSCLVLEGAARRFIVTGGI